MDGTIETFQKLMVLLIYQASLETFLHFFAPFALQELQTLKTDVADKDRWLRNFMSKTSHPAVNSLAAGPVDKFKHLWEKPHHRGTRLFQPRSSRFKDVHRKKIGEQNSSIL